MAAIRAPRIGGGDQTPTGDVVATDSRDAGRLEREAGTFAAAESPSP